MFVNHIWQIKAEFEGGGEGTHYQRRGIFRRHGLPEKDLQLGAPPSKQNF